VPRNNDHLFEDLCLSLSCVGKSPL